LKDSAAGLLIFRQATKRLIGRRNGGCVFRSGLAVVFSGQPFSCSFPSPFRLFWQLSFTGFSGSRPHPCRASSSPTVLLGLLPGTEEQPNAKPQESGWRAAGPGPRQSGCGLARCAEGGTCSAHSRMRCFRASSCPACGQFLAVIANSRPYTTGWRWGLLQST
jgi:hypothetical protein